MVLLPPQTYCPDGLSHELQYFTLNKVKRKPLQALAVGAFVAGAILGGTMRRGVAITIIQFIKIELYHTQKINADTGKALYAISQSSNVLNTMETDRYCWKHTLGNAKGH